MCVLFADVILLTSFRNPHNHNFITMEAYRSNLPLNSGGSCLLIVDPQNDFHPGYVFFGFGEEEKTGTCSSGSSAMLLLFGRREREARSGKEAGD